MEENKLEHVVTPEAPKPNGPPDRPETDFAHIAHWGTRQMAWKEYQRTVQEFRHTGSIQKKTWKDFAHFVHPRDLSDHVFAAYQKAAGDIGQWNRKQWKEQEEARRLREAEEARARDEEARARLMSEMAAGSSDQDEDREDEADDADEPDEQMLPVAAASAVARPVGLLRGVVFDPDAPGRNARFDPAIPQLDVAPPPARLPDADDHTEALLNAMIGECHFLMRAVAFPSLCHARVADDRLNWMEKAMDLAKTGATVAKAVARLRHGPAVRESHQKITVENKVAVVQGGGGRAIP
jgi:hypothetical protein